MGKSKYLILLTEYYQLEVIGAQIVAAWKRATIFSSITKLNVVDEEIATRHGISGHEVRTDAWILVHSESLWK